MPATNRAGEITGMSFWIKAAVELSAENPPVSAENLVLTIALFFPI
jgi:hypothetical protein